MTPCSSWNTNVCIASPLAALRIPGRTSWSRFGKARTWKEGTDITVVTYGAVVPRALQAAQRIEREQGVSVELIDLRTLNPYDWEAIANSVKKTNRVIVAHEDTLELGLRRRDRSAHR